MGSATSRAGTGNSGSGNAGSGNAGTGNSGSGRTGATTTGATATGTVTEVGEVADASSGVAKYPVTVSFDADTSDFYVGSTVTGDIATNTRDERGAGLVRGGDDDQRRRP